MPRKTRSVLIVDDNATARNVVSHVLRRERSFRIRAVAHNGLEAIALTGDDCPDLIVLDHEMPGMTGLEALPRLRAQCPDARIVMWSMADDIEQDVLSAGGNGFISKNEPLDRLVEWLKAA
ncbi:MAG: response regulator transcription factor [Actinobacteria bacterium]|nr:response regulator transcription factor [Actinomycetota bacterium]MCA1719679.1 response regulator transcription factor [Actinomycetota bacterium]